VLSCSLEGQEQPALRAESKTQNILPLEVESHDAALCCVVVQHLQRPLYSAEINSEAV
jgi:hypothetical protein